jgi:hypothetical protein
MILFNNSESRWYYSLTDTEQLVVPHEVYHERYSSENVNIQHQSMAMASNCIFCFESGSGVSIYDYQSLKKTYYGSMPDDGHHNNAQFSSTYYSQEDRFPLLIISRGDYPPATNAFYVYRISGDRFVYHFKIIKTIHNNIEEAHNNGSWIIDDDNKLLYLYCLDHGDYRTTEFNHFCIFQFQLPDLLSEEQDVYLTQDDVLNKWTFPYMIHQGGTCHNGYLYFNVQDISSLWGKQLKWKDRNVVVFNPNRGQFELVLPLYESLETEGICIYNNKMFVTFKDGHKGHLESFVMFKIMQYDLPALNDYE